MTDQFILDFEERAGSFRAMAARASEELQTLLAALRDVPDFVRLGNFPNHCAGPICWCRPAVILGAQGFIVRHKSLGDGEFDC